MDIQNRTEALRLEARNMLFKDLGSRVLSNIFLGTIREEDNMIYFDKKEQKVLQLVSGYFLNLEDNQVESQKVLLKTKMETFEVLDSVIEGRHFLIDRIKIEEFKEEWDLIVQLDSNFISVLDEFIVNESYQPSDYFNSNVLKGFINHVMIVFKLDSKTSIQFTKHMDLCMENIGKRWVEKIYFNKRF